MSSGKPYMGAVVNFQRKAGEGRPEAAVVTTVNPDGTLDLHVLQTTFSGAPPDSVTLIDFPVQATPHTQSVATGTPPIGPPAIIPAPPPPIAAAPPAPLVGDFE